MIYYQTERKEKGFSLQQYFTFIAPINQEMFRYKEGKLICKMGKTVKPESKHSAEYECVHKIQRSHTQVEET